MIFVCDENPEILLVEKKAVLGIAYSATYCLQPQHNPYRQI